MKKVLLGIAGAALGALLGWVLSLGGIWIYAVRAFHARLTFERARPSFYVMFPLGDPGWERFSVATPIAMILAIALGAGLGAILALRPSIPRER